MPAGEQVKVSFPGLQVQFTSEPGLLRKIWRFRMLMGHGRWLSGLVLSEPRAEWSAMQ